MTLGGFEEKVARLSVILIYINNVLLIVFLLTINSTNNQLVKLVKYLLRLCERIEVNFKFIRQPICLLTLKTLLK